MKLIVSWMILLFTLTFSVQAATPTPEASPEVASVARIQRVSAHPRRHRHKPHRAKHHRPHRHGPGA